MQNEIKMETKDILAQLEALGDEKMRAQNKKRGAGDNQFGVKMGDIRNIAKKLKTNHELALKLWDTENVEARFLATLLIDPKKLSNDELARIVSSEKFTHMRIGFIRMS